MYILIGFWIAGAIKTIKGFNLDLEGGYLGTSHFETTYNSSTDTYKTQSVDDSYVGEDVGKAIFLGISYPLWSFPYFINKNVKFFKECPAEIYTAYTDTVASVARIEIPKTFIENRKKAIKKHKEKEFNIKSTYFALGEKEIE